MPGSSEVLTSSRSTGGPPALQDVGDRDEESSLFEGRHESPPPNPGTRSRSGNKLPPLSSPPIRVTPAGRGKNVPVIKKNGLRGRGFFGQYGDSIEDASGRLGVEPPTKSTSPQSSRTSPRASPTRSPRTPGVAQSHSPLPGGRGLHRQTEAKRALRFAEQQLAQDTAIKIKKTEESAVLEIKIGKRKKAYADVSSRVNTPAVVRAQTSPIFAAGGLENRAAKSKSSRQRKRLDPPRGGPTSAHVKTDKDHGTPALLFEDPGFDAPDWDSSVFCADVRGGKESAAWGAPLPRDWLEEDYANAERNSPPRRRSSSLGAHHGTKLKTFKEKLAPAERKDLSELFENSLAKRRLAQVLFEMETASRLVGKEADVRPGPPFAAPFPAGSPTEESAGDEQTGAGKTASEQNGAGTEAGHLSAAQGVRGGFTASPRGGDVVAGTVVETRPFVEEGGPARIDGAPVDEDHQQTTAPGPVLALKAVYRQHEQKTTPAQQDHGSFRLDEVDQRGSAYASSISSSSAAVVLPLTAEESRERAWDQLAKSLAEMEAHIWGKVQEVLPRREKEEWEQRQNTKLDPIFEKECEQESDGASIRPEGGADTYGEGSAGGKFSPPGKKNSVEEALARVEEQRAASESEQTPVPTRAKRSGSAGSLSSQPEQVLGGDLGWSLSESDSYHSTMGSDSADQADLAMEVQLGISHGSEARARIEQRCGQKAEEALEMAARDPSPTGGFGMDGSLNDVDKIIKAGVKQGDKQNLAARKEKWAREREERSKKGAGGGDVEESVGGSREEKDDKTPQERPSSSSKTASPKQAAPTPEEGTASSEARAQPAKRAKSKPREKLNEDEPFPAMEEGAAAVQEPDAVVADAPPAAAAAPDLHQTSSPMDADGMDVNSNPSHNDSSESSTLNFLGKGAERRLGPPVNVNFFPQVGKKSTLTGGPNVDVDVESLSAEKGTDDVSARNSTKREDASGLMSSSEKIGPLGPPRSETPDVIWLGNDYWDEIFTAPSSQQSTLRTDEAALTHDSGTTRRGNAEHYYAELRQELSRRGPPVSKFGRRHKEAGYFAQERRYFAKESDAERRRIREAKAVGLTPLQNAKARREQAKRDLREILEQKQGVIAQNREEKSLRKQQLRIAMHQERESQQARLEVGRQDRKK